MAVINLYNATIKGSVIMTGNTIGLAGSGPLGIARFTIGLPLNTPPSGTTTTNFSNNSSSAQLILPPGSIVKSAQLIWSAFSSNPTSSITPGDQNNTIHFRDPTGNINNIVPTLANRQLSGTIAIGRYSNYGNATDVTAIVAASGSGFYTVGKVPGVFGAEGEWNGWILIVAYENLSEPLRNLNIWSALNGVGAGFPLTVNISGFATPSVGPVTGRLILSAGNGNSSLTGESAYFGPTTSSLIQLSGPNNNATNFFASQINNNNGNLDTTGTFGNANVVPPNPTAPGQRNNWDITRVNVSAGLVNNQTSAVIRLTTINDAISLNGIGLQVDTVGAFLTIVKSVDKSTAILGDYLTYTLVITNSGTIQADNVVIQDVLDSSLSFVFGTITSTATYMGTDIQAGITLNSSIPVGGTVTVTFQAQINLAMPAQNPIPNSGTTNYTFEPAIGVGPVAGNNVSNIVTTLVNAIYDFGDAPDISPGNGIGDYSTLIANNGPYHEVINNLKFGTQVTMEIDAYQNTNADGDDIGQGIQDDGLATWPQYQQGSSTYSLNFQYTNDLGINSNVYGWIDWNRDGIFQLNEMANFVVVAPSSTINPQNSVLSFTVPSNTMVAGNITYARIRITTDTLINSNGGANQEDTRSLGPASDGEVEDYLVTVTLPPLDFGDAPDTGSGNGMGNYSTLLANNGPRHFFSPNLLLGTQVTTEADAYQNTNADGDDIGQGIQDDGLATWPQYQQGSSTYSLNFQYTNNLGINSNVYGWIDWNRDGIFQLNEMANFVVVAPSSTINPQNSVLSFTVPSNTMVAGNITYARIRITTDTLINSNGGANQEDTRSLGLASNGEVEDYLVTVTLPPLDFGDAPDTGSGNGMGNYSTLLANNGPRHLVSPNLLLGTQVTTEADAYQNTNADGDDIGQGIQDDGLATWPQINQGVSNYSLSVSYTNAIGSTANIYGWIDFNKDGIFQLEESATTVIMSSSTTNPRTVSLNFTVPSTSTLVKGDITYARLRITTNNLLNTNSSPNQEDTRSLGLASDGEVEDYLVIVLPPYDFGDAPDINAGNGNGNYSTLLSNNGPRHQVNNNLKLGSNITIEADAYENTNADGDDIGKSIQDDGLTSWPIFYQGITEKYFLDLNYTNYTGVDANIYAWIDWNRDGVFQLNEAANPLSVPSYYTNTRKVTLEFDLPPGTFLNVGDDTYIRIRITTDTLVNTNGGASQEDTRSLGAASDGEVEDYLVTVQYNDMDYGDAPDISSGNGTGDYTTRLANNGPRHFIVDGLKLGGFITAEVDGYENATATGDDLSKGIQDDGISPSPPNLVIGDSSYKVNIGYINSTGNAAYIYAWLDWNRDGIFQLSEINEVTITSSTSINPRSLNLIYNKPANLTLADGEETFLRVRLTTEKLINKNSLTTQEDTRSIGLSQSGEVEDYLVNIIDLNINGVIWYDLNCDGIQNPGEPLAGNVVVELYSTNNPSVAIESTTTDNLGKYSFPGLPQGTYFVKVKLPNGYEFTISKVGINPNIDSDVDKETGQSAALILNQYNKTHVVDAGLCKLNNISGYAFYDCNSDGILNSNESLLCGVVFNLFDMNNNQIATTTTNCDGKYEFNNISPGTYTVKTISPSGMNLTTQNSSYYGSKPNINGVFTTTLTNTDYSEGFAGFRGTLGQTVKYCVTCNNNNNNTSFCS